VDTATTKFVSNGVSILGVYSYTQLSAYDSNTSLQTCDHPICTVDVFNHEFSWYNLYHDIYCIMISGDTHPYRVDDDLRGGRYGFSAILWQVQY